MLKFTVILSIAVCFASASEPDFMRCKPGDLDCVKDRINYYLHEKNQGDKGINLIKIDPLSVNKINIKQGADSPVNIDLTFTKNDIVGLQNIEAYKVKGFGKDMTKRHEIHVKARSVSLVGDYSITGKVLILPISGNGKSNMTIDEADIKLVFHGTPYEKDGATYMKIEDMKLLIEPKRLYYQFTNLFNGDKALGDNMNLFLNENWREIFNELQDSIQNAFARIFEQVMSNVFSKHPYEKYFAAE